MAEVAPKVRLFVTQPLAAGREVAPAREQAHYLFTVMRLGEGAEVALFNGADGEWRAQVTRADRKGGALICAERLREQDHPPDLRLLFAPIKKARTDFIAEKAAELGVRRLGPVFTRFTNAERVNVERLRAHAVEAAEQCGLLTIPEIDPPASLSAILDAWEPERRLLFCDEAREAAPAQEVLRAAGPGKWAVLIGPEGGFSPDERARLRGLPFAHAASLGPRVLRADTAAVAALAIWQATLGDWA